MPHLDVGRLQKNLTQKRPKFWIDHISLMKSIEILLYNIGRNEFSRPSPINDIAAIYWLMNERESFCVQHNSNYLSSEFCVEREGLIQ